MNLISILPMEPIGASPGLFCSPKGGGTWFVQWLKWVEFNLEVSPGACQQWRKHCSSVIYTPNEELLSSFDHFNCSIYVSCGSNDAHMRIILLLFDATWLDQRDYMSHFFLNQLCTSTHQVITSQSQLVLIRMRRRYRHQWFLTPTGKLLVWSHTVFT